MSFVFIYFFCILAIFTFTTLVYAVVELKKRKINLVDFLGLQNKKEGKVSKLRHASKPFTLPEFSGNIKALQKRP